MMELKFINFLLCLTLINVRVCVETEKNNDEGTSTTKEPVVHESQEVTSGKKGPSKKKGALGSNENPTGGMKNLYRKLVLNEDEAWREGREQYDNKNYQDALALFSIAIKKDKRHSNPWNYLFRARCYLKLNQRTKAIQDFDEVLKREDSTSITYQSAVIQAVLEFEELYEIILKELCCITDHAFVQVAYKICTKNLKYQQALCLYANALQKKQYREYYLSRATCYFEMGKLEDARSDVEEASRAKSWHLENDAAIVERTDIGLKNEYLSILEAWVYAKFSTKEFKGKLWLSEEEAAKEGLELFDKQQYPEALLLFQIAIKRNKSASNYISRGKCYVKMDMLQKAEQDFKEVAKRDPWKTSTNQILVLETMLETISDVETFHKIITNLKTVIKPLTLIGFGHILCSNKEFERAICVFDGALLIGPYKEYYLARAMCLSKMGKLDEARIDYMKGKDALSCTSRSFLDVDLYSELEALNEEVEFFAPHLLKTTLHNADLEGKLLMNHSDFAQVGEKLFDAGKYDDAILFYTSAIEMQPVAEYYMKRGNCYSMLGQEDWAQREYRAATDIKVSDPENSSEYAAKDDTDLQYPPENDGDKM